MKIILKNSSMVFQNQAEPVKLGELEKWNTNANNLNVTVGSSALEGLGVTTGRLKVMVKVTDADYAADLTGKTITYVNLGQAEYGSYCTANYTAGNDIICQCTIAGITHGQTKKVLLEVWQ